MEYNRNTPHFVFYLAFLKVVFSSIETYVTKYYGETYD